MSGKHGDTLSPWNLNERFFIKRKIAKIKYALTSKTDIKLFSCNLFTSAQAKKYPLCEKRIAEQPRSLVFKESKDSVGILHLEFGNFCQRGGSCATRCNGPMVSLLRSICCVSVRWSLEPPGMCLQETKRRIFMLRQPVHYSSSSRLICRYSFRICSIPPSNADRRPGWKWLGMFNGLTVT